MKGHRLYVRKEVRDRVEVYYGHCTCEEWDRTLMAHWYSKEEAHRFLKSDFHQHRDKELNRGTPMMLIGKAFLQTVTHEIWLAHAFGDLPEFYEVRDTYTGELHRPNIWTNGFLVVQRNSKGYKPYSQTWNQDKEYALLDAYSRLKRYEMRGYEIEWAVNFDRKEIELPQRPVDKYVTDLVERSKEVTDVREVKALQELLDQVISSLDLLKSARSEMIERIVAL